MSIVSGTLKNKQFPLFTQKRTSEGGPDNIRMAGYMEKQPVRGNLKRVKYTS